MAVLLLLAFAALCSAPLTFDATFVTPKAPAIDVGKAGGSSKLWTHAHSLQTRLAPVSPRLKVHALRGSRFELGAASVTAIPPCAPQLALDLPDRRAAIRRACPRLDRPDPARRAV